MASLNLLLLPLLIIIANSFMIIKTQAFDKEPMNCSSTIFQCNASLYHATNNYLIPKEDIASHYSVDVSHLKPIRRPINAEHDDYLVTVPCTCRNTSDLSGYFYETTYTVEPNDTVHNISDVVYNGQAWILGNHSLLTIGEKLTIYLPCGCSTGSDESHIVVTTYTVLQNDTISAIASLLNSTVDNMQHVNRILNSNPSFIDVGWVLFVPTDLNGIPTA